ncbi:hypothetical protein AVEN_63025-1 [Araneus ventricosus]|uniref:Uncharacterized protein n=1 Tax=Araneus ventricosus TaxID=182803 RepID=A0A4Y2CTF6_ARAVE|nr:hypothetical protein AVEN_63025-1 [Araneus ventricosus]
MRSCWRSVSIPLLMDSNISPRVCRAWQPSRRVVHCGLRYINSAGLLKGIKRQWSTFLGLLVKGGRRSRKLPLEYTSWIAYKASTEAWDARASNCLPLLGSVLGGAVGA